jgi:enamine deaminase RidA (YjgF/YER057c/UK114 family)
MLLEEAGSSLQQICEITIYITDPRYQEAVYLVVGGHRKGVFSVSTGILVSVLAPAGMLVEVDAIAVILD